MELRSERSTLARSILPWLVCAAGAFGTLMPGSVWAVAPNTQTDAPGDWTTSVRIYDTAGAAGTANLFAEHTTASGLIELSFVTADHIFRDTVYVGGLPTQNSTTSAVSEIGMGNAVGGVNLFTGTPAVVQATTYYGSGIGVTLGQAVGFPDVAVVNMQLNPANFTPAQAAAVAAMLPIGLGAAPATPGFVVNLHGFGNTAETPTPADTALINAPPPSNANSYLLVQHPVANVAPGGAIYYTPAAAESYGTERYLVQTAQNFVNNYTLASAPYYNYTAMQWTLPTPAAATLTNPDALALSGDSGSGLFSVDSHQFVGILTTASRPSVITVGGVPTLWGYGTGSQNSALDFNQPMVNALNSISSLYFAPEPSSEVLLAVGAVVAGICAAWRRTRAMAGRACRA